MAESSKISFEDLPLADWLEALGHEGPFEGHEMPRLSAAVETLLPRLQDADPKVRLRAVKALGVLGGEAHRTLSPLRAALKHAAIHDKDEAVRTHAVHAVLQLGPQPASEIAGLIDSLKDEIPAVRFHAAIALGDHGRDAEAAIPALTHAHIWDADPAVRVEAAVSLWKIDHRAALVLPALMKALEHENELICWMAADCLRRIGAEARDAVPALQKALQRDFKVALIRKGVALALDRIQST